MTRWRDYDSTQIPASYDRARSHSPEVTKLWLNTVTNFVRAGSVTRILDLGCGTGRFSGSLAEHFASPVIGIDPSQKMLKQAHAKSVGHRERLFHVLGRGEDLPIRAGSVDLVFISMVFHHFANPAVVAGECRRVLKDGGIIFIRTATVERSANYPHVPFFPESVELMEAILPTAASVTEVFHRAGFARVEGGVVIQEFASSYSEYAEKIAAGGDSVLARLPESAFAAGVERLRTYATAAGAGAVKEPIDFFVFSNGAKL